MRNSNQTLVKTLATASLAAFGATACNNNPFAHEMGATTTMMNDDMSKMSMSATTSNMKEAQCGAEKNTEAKCGASNMNGAKMIEGSCGNH